MYRDPAGDLTSDSTYAYGATWTNTYDPANAQPWLWKTDHFDANDRLVETTTTMDDGTHTLTINDVNNQYGWSTFTLTYDAAWNVTGTAATRDDGSHAISQGEIAAALDATTWFSTPYDHTNYGAAIAITLSGGPGDDVLYGSRAGDTLSGGGGNDLIVGGQGNDTLTGGAGTDRFVFHNGDGLDTITDFTHGQDVIALHDYDVATFADLQALMTQNGSDTVIAFDPADTITLHNVMAATLTASDFLLH